MTASRIQAAASKTAAQATTQASQAPQAKVPPPPPPPPVQQQQQQAQKPAAEVSAAVPVPDGQKIIAREEKVEYRDQNGNLLNEEQVKALEGKVEFKTRYETRTRVIDAAGNEVLVKKDEAQPGVAPPHPDVEGK